MAKILYGVHGTNHGHAIRALTIARRFSHHEFLFVSQDAGAAILKWEFPMVALPGLETVFRRHRVAIAATIGANLRPLIQARNIRRQILDLMDRFRPDLGVTDFEAFIPWVCRSVGLPCLSLDHQHVITCCSHPVPVRRLPQYFLARLLIQALYNRADEFGIISFYRPPLRGHLPARLLPPLLRDTVLARRPREGDHVLAYQRSRSLPEFLDFLRRIPRPVVVYGAHEDRREGNLTFKPHSEEGFLDDLASCSYVIAGGGHTLMSEALFYGKPILAFPFRGDFEQYLNAFYLARLGYGAYAEDFRAGAGLLKSFESGLEHYRRAVGQGSFCGNEAVFTLVEEFIGGGGQSA